MLEEARVSRGQQVMPSRGKRGRILSIGVARRRQVAMHIKRPPCPCSRLRHLASLQFVEHVRRDAALHASRWPMPLENNKRENPLVTTRRPWWDEKQEDL